MRRFMTLYMELTTLGSRIRGMVRFIFRNQSAKEKFSVITLHPSMLVWNGVTMQRWHVQRYSRCFYRNTGMHYLG